LPRAEHALAVESLTDYEPDVSCAGEMRELRSGRRAQTAVLLLAAATTIGAAAAVATVGSSSVGIQGGGPLACEPGACSSSGAVLVEVGEPVTVGTLVLRNRGDEPATLTKLTLVDKPGSLEVVAIKALRLRDRPEGLSLTGIGRGFPPPGTAAALRSLAGTRVDPSRSPAGGVEVLIGLRPATRGSFAYRSLLLEYRVGLERYATSYAMPFRVCAPYMDVTRCPTP
jgi:hypothetical protein